MKKKKVQRFLVGAACAVMAFSQMPSTMYVEADEPDYEVVTDENGKRVKSVSDLNVGDEMKVNVTDGFFKTKVVSKEGKDGR